MSYVDQKKNYLYPPPPGTLRFILVRIRSRLMLEFREKRWVPISCEKDSHITGGRGGVKWEYPEDTGYCPMVNDILLL